MTPTYCETCDNVHPESRKKSPSQWLCIKFPRLEGGGFVAPKVWAATDPFNRCVNVNLGYCPLWAPMRNGQRDNGL